MNERHDASEEFSLERQRRAGRAFTREKREDESIARAPNKPSSEQVTDSAFPDHIRRKYYVVATESEKDGSNREARLYADERKEYLAFKTTDDRLVTRLAVAGQRGTTSPMGGNSRPWFRRVPARGLA